MSVNSTFSIIRFGQFELNLETGELRRQGEKIKLQEQPFQVLAALLERPGKLVTREELHSRLWPADTFVDFDHSLNAAIKRLREALGESADSPVFIETLARRGYRFIAPVSGPAVLSGIKTAPSREQSLSFLLTRRIAFVWVAAFLIVAALVSVIRWYPSSATNAKEQKLTSNSSENNVNSAAISPDGKHLAYADNTGVYVKLIRTGETHAVTLPSNFSAHVDDWFPDGFHLLVTRTDPGGRTSLWNISILGGSPRLLADDASGGSTSPDGDRIAFHRADLTYEGWFGREVWIMRSDGTGAIKVASDGSSRMGTPTWSPDGKRIAYVKTALAYNSPSSLIEVNEWQSAKTESLFSDKGLTPGLEWLSDGRLIYSVSTEQGPRDSSMFAAKILPSGKLSGAPNRITRGAGGITQVSGSADGKVLACLREHWSPSIYIGTLTADGTDLLAHRRLTLDENASIPTAWTLDSKAVLFSSDRNGTSEIFKQNTDHSIAESLVTSIEHLSQPRLTPDGSEILYVSTPQSTNAETPSSIFATPVAGGAPRLILQDVGIYAVECARSPSTVCLYSISKGNTRQTFHFDLRTGKIAGAPQVDPDGFWSLSPDGSQRAFVAVGSNQDTIQLRSTSSDESRDLVVKGWNGLMHIDWSADGHSLLVGSHHQQQESALLRVTLDGKVSVLLRSNDFIGYAIPSPDGRLLAILEVKPTKNAWQIVDF